MAARLFRSVDFLPADAAWTHLCSGHPDLFRMVGLTSCTALWTIFICPLCSCTFRKRRFRNHSSAQLNSLGSNASLRCSRVTFYKTHPHSTSKGCSELL